mmetsp:Transcript_16843/g.19237  ORF Transcript_16843/g.19237 Transcript_16843/m.19237 type:complete len:253 (-) Transcript_16843:206-964(-)
MISTTLATATAFVVATTMNTVSAMEGGQPAISFSAPIGFTQYMDTCEGEPLYSGRINKITMLDTGSFCVIDTIPGADGSETTAYSRLDVVDCTSDKVYDHWYKCTDEMCADCEMEYRSYTAWESFVSSSKDQCYTYHFTRDSLEGSVREERSAPMQVTVGSFEDTITVSFNFDEDAVDNDVMAYLHFVKDNSCVALGKPSEDPVYYVPKETEVKQPTMDAMDAAKEEVSSSNTVAFSTVAVLVMAVATSMVL